MASQAQKKIAGLLGGVVRGGNLPVGLLGSQGSMSSYTPTARERLTALIAKGLLGDTREGFRKAGKVIDIAEMSPVGLLTGMYDAGRAAGGGNMMQAGVLGGLAAMPLPPAVKKGIRAYHGSPHSFDKFSMDKIGTGEGAQAYGHGLYFAEGEGVARSYRENLAGGNRALPSWFSSHHMGEARDAAKKAGYSGAELEAAMLVKNAVYLGAKSRKEVLENIKRYGEPSLNMTTQEAIDKVAVDLFPEEAAGHMYEVNIDADPEQFLDWDKPLSEQPASAQAILNKSGVAPTADVGSAISYAKSMRNPLEDQLKQAGIPGIKYLDAGSRAKGDGSRNYVVFDEKLISIVRKYGIAGASTLLGYDLLSNVTTDQAEKLKQAERVY